MDRNETIKQIRKNLKDRSGKTWSVTGGTGTSWGWISIDAPPRRRTFESDGVTPGGCYASKAEKEELAQLLGLTGMHFQGISIPSSNGHYQEYVDRSTGITPTVIGEQYWD